MLQLSSSHALEAMFTPQSQVCSADAVFHAQKKLLDVSSLMQYEVLMLSFMPGRSC